MQRPILSRSVSFVLVLVLVLVFGGRPALALPQDDGERVSAFGRYEGWSEELFDGWETSSVYVAMRDGVRLAVDVTRPTFYGELVEEPLPLVWTHSRYHRRPPVPGVRSMVDADPALQRLVRHGYVVAVVDVRGSGASFGRSEGLFSEAETRDAAEMIAWFAAQPWCDGNVGMWGGSYLGITQYMAASQAPPALKAIFPDVAAFDMYGVVYPGGALRSDMMVHWAALTTRLDRELLAPPVDADPQGELLRAAVAEHAKNFDVIAGYSSAPFRDDVVPGLAWNVNGPSGLLPAIRKARVPAYHICGWFDIFATDALLWWANYEGPQKLTMGPWAHAGIDHRGVDQERRRVTAIEQHRWFDRWLKGIENGVDAEAPIHYALIEEPGRWTWKATDAWPPAARATRYHLGPGASGSVSSRNDGRLTLPAPVEADACDVYAVDPTTTTGTTSRWDNAVGDAAVTSYPHLAENDRRCLTYTTEPLEQDVAVVGHPLARLFVASSAEDAEVIVLLEEVGAKGDVRYVTEGVLRGSHRTLGEAPWNNLGLPFQRGCHADFAALPRDEPTELVLDLHPTANVFDAGHRIRVTLMGADADNVQVLPNANETTLRVFRDAAHPSSIELPILPVGR
jgi:putative CocE/NonD family hydrolase